MHWQLFLAWTQFVAILGSCENTESYTKCWQQNKALLKSWANIGFLWNGILLPGVLLLAQIGTPLTAARQQTDVTIKITITQCSMWLNMRWILLTFTHIKMYRSTMCSILSNHLKSMAPPGPAFQLATLRAGFGPYGPAWLSSLRPSCAQAVWPTHAPIHHRLTP